MQVMSVLGARVHGSLEKGHVKRLHRGDGFYLQDEHNWPGDERRHRMEGREHGDNPHQGWGAGERAHALSREAVRAEMRGKQDLIKMELSGIH